jgi:hypothetical protein
MSHIRCVAWGCLGHPLIWSRRVRLAPALALYAQSRIRYMHACPFMSDTGACRLEEQGLVLRLKLPASQNSSAPTPDGDLVDSSATVSFAVPVTFPGPAEIQPHLQVTATGTPLESAALRVRARCRLQRSSRPKTVSACSE